MSKWEVVKLVESWKLKSGIDKGDVREKKNGGLKKIKKIKKKGKKKLLNINVELWLSEITLLTFIFYFKSKSIDFKYGVF